MFLKVNAEHPNRQKIQTIVECLKSGGVIVFPTDTVYSIGCDIHNKEGVRRICRIKGIKEKKLNFSLICNDLSEISKYTLQFDRAVYKSLNKNLPGPFTFILKATNEVSRLFEYNKKTIGIRVPNNNIIREIISQLGTPLVSTSLRHEDEILEYVTDPEEIFDKLKHDVDIVIDGGMGDNTPSTVIDYTTGEPEVVREGKGTLYV